ncbi:MAG: hypothetical protein QOH26_1608, partial [Actinomycetota bacterium]|nr:hypothetical protein [Actinomycetota bacterium]
VDAYLVSFEASLRFQAYLYLGRLRRGASETERGPHHERRHKCDQVTVPRRDTEGDRQESGNCNDTELRRRSHGR